EGSVCQAMLPLLAQHGIRWIATDEEILNRSTQGLISRDSHGHVRHPERLYRPYKVREGNAELSIVFRDHALSDMIGFHYQRSEAQAAADDFVRHLHGISKAVGGTAPVLVSIILDGENCWEHYSEGGVPFLRALYKRCTTTPGLRPVKLGSFLEKHPPGDTLPHLFAGSWIGHNFAIWIGHDEDNTAWDALHRAREYLKDKETRRQGAPETTEAGAGTVSLSPCPPVSQSPLQRAWEELYIAEGSDWFWWYGDEHSSAQDALFDYLFRKHLQNVYVLLGDEPPPELARPISRRGQRVHYTQPRELLEVRIDGKYSFFEWVSGGHYSCHNERGTMAMARMGPLREVFFGFDLMRLLIRVDCDGPARQALADYDRCRVGLAQPAGCEVRIDR